jgi:hypothetical protein
MLRVSRADTHEMQWDIDTFHEMWRLAKEVPGAGIHVIDLTKYFQYGMPVPWYSNLFPEVSSWIWYALAVAKAVLVQKNSRRSASSRCQKWLLLPDNVYKHCSLPSLALVPMP